jgi:myo-inositol-1(or 4)-monophosphatase
MSEQLLEVAREAAEAAARSAMAWRARAAELRVEEKAGPADLVSQADRDAERAVRTVLARTRPDDAVLGEEGGTAAGSTGIVWVVDPVDGTTNYVYGRDEWAVSVAAVRVDGPPGPATVAAGEVLAGVVTEPVVGRTTWARRGGGAWCDGVRLHVRPTTDLAQVLVEMGLGRPPLRQQAGRLVELVDRQVRDVRRGGSAAIALAQVATGRADASWGPGLQVWDAAAGVLLVREAGGTVGDLNGPLEDGIPPTGAVLSAAPGVFEALRSVLAEVYAA